MDRETTVNAMIQQGLRDRFGVGDLEPLAVEGVDKPVGQLCAVVSVANSTRSRRESASRKKKKEKEKEKRESRK